MFAICSPVSRDVLMLDGDHSVLDVYAGLLDEFDKELPIGTPERTPDGVTPHPAAPPSAVSSPLVAQLRRVVSLGSRAVNLAKDTAGRLTPGL